MSTVTRAQAQLSGQYSVTLTRPDALTVPWGPAWLHSPRRPEPEPQQSVEQPLPTPAATVASTLEASKPADFDGCQRASDCDDDANEFYWANITAADLDHLLAPSSPCSPCLWCGGRLRHSRSCDELQLAWQPKMPFGKYKGKPLLTIPHSYLHWVLESSFATDELCEAIRKLLALSSNPLPAAGDDFDDMESDWPATDPPTQHGPRRVTRRG